MVAVQKSGGGRAHYAEDVVDLNEATMEELLSLPDIDERKAWLIRENRPFERWDEVERLEGFDAGIIERLKAGRAEIRKL